MSKAKEVAKSVYSWSKTVVSGFMFNHCSMHAAGLTYFSMLSMVPSLCLLLFFAKTCGIDDCARNSINNHIDIMIQNIEKGQDDYIVSTLADVNVISASPPLSSASRRVRSRTAYSTASTTST